MTLGADLVAALPELQAHAESMMFDSVIVRRQTGTTPDYESGEDVPTYVTVYAGRCRLVMRSTVVSDADSASELVALQGPRLDVPVSGTAGIKPDDRFELTSGDSVGLTGRVSGVFPQSLKTARRLPVQISG